MLRALVKYLRDNRKLIVREVEVVQRVYDPTYGLSEHKSIESMIEVLQAYKDGKKIEYRIVGNTQWSATDDPQWQFSNCEYRIAPEPKKKVKLEAWFGENKRLIWVEKGFYEKSPPFWTRVPSEDKEILL